MGSHGSASYEGVGAMECVVLGSHRSATCSACVRPACSFWPAPANCRASAHRTLCCGERSTHQRTNASCINAPCVKASTRQCVSDSMPPCVTALHHKAFEFELATVAAVGASSFNAQQPMPPALGDFVLEVRLFRQALIGAQTLLGTVELQGAALAEQGGHSHRRVRPVDVDPLHLHANGVSI